MYLDTIVVQSGSGIEAALIAAVGAIAVVAIGTSLSAFFQARASRRADTVAKKVEEVRVTQVESAGQVEAVRRALAASDVSTTSKLGELRAIAQGTHGLVNHTNTVQLRVIADLRQTIAELQPDNAKAKGAAEASEAIAAAAETEELKRLQEAEAEAARDRWSVRNP